MKFAPGSTQTPAQNSAIPDAVGVAVGKAMTKRYVLTIDGIDCTEVTNIDAITIRIPAGGSPQVAPVKLQLRYGSNPAPWKAWFESLAADPNGGETLEKQGTIEVSDGQKLLLTLNLKGLGVMSVTPTPLQPACMARDKAPEVELYCEGVTVKVPPPPPPPPAKKTDRSQFPRPLNLPPLGTKPDVTAKLFAAEEDKGAKDPEGMPRYTDCVRTSYASIRSKTSLDETAEYTTKSELAKVEAFFSEEMKKLGWTPAYRTENGKDAGYTVDIRWENQKRQAKVVLGRTKENDHTTIFVRLITPVQ